MPRLIKKNCFLRDSFLIFSFSFLLLIWTNESLFGQETRLVVKDAAGTSDVFTVDDEGTINANIARFGELATSERAYRVFNMVGEKGGIRNWRIHDAWPPFVELMYSRPSSPDNIVSYWDFAAGPQYGPNMFWIRDRTNGIDAIRLSINGSGNVGIGLGTQDASYKLHVVGGAYCNGTSWVDASSREYKTNIKELTLDEASNTLKYLSPVKFLYKTENTGEMHVGFIAEDVPDLVATKDRKGLSSMEIVGVLTKVVQEQQKTIAELSRKVTELERKTK